MSTLYTDNIRANNASQITVPTGQKIVGTDAGSIVAPGHVIQTVFGPEVGTEINTTSTSFVVVSSSLAASITPKFNNSKIIVRCNVPNLMMWNSTNDGRVQLGISVDGGSTFIKEFNNRIYDYGGSGIQLHYSAILEGIHSPSSTAQQTYNLYWHIDAGYARINDDQGVSNEGVSGTAGACFTQFILQEIAQ